MTPPSQLFNRIVLVASLLVLFAGTTTFASQPDDQSASPQQRRGRNFESPGLYKSRMEPHWFAGNSQFWYRNNLRGGNKEFVLVDVESGTRRPAFDHAKLAASLSEAASETYRADQLPFDRIEFVDDNKSLQFVVEGKQWECAIDTYQCTRLGDAPAEDDDDRADDRSRFGRRRFGRRDGEGGRSGRGGRSPDGKWEAFVRDGNVFIRAAEATTESNDDRDGAKSADEIQLSNDGTDTIGYGQLRWSPDSAALVAFRIEPGDNKEVYLVESSPSDGGRARLRTRQYDLPGDKLTTFELNLFDIAAKKQSKPAVDRIDWGSPRVRWLGDGHHFAYEKVDRGHQRFRVICVDALTGETREIIDEKSNTFIWTVHTENLDLDLVNYLPDSNEIIYVSERDGWRHLYQVDVEKGEIKNQITKGEFVVRGIDRIDEEARQIWFSASSRNADQDPYFIHYYRVNFDGTELTALTDGDGNHRVQFSPDRKYLIDTYSRVDMPPKHDLRRASDGKLVCALEESDASELMERGDYRPLEPFVAKGRDGTTDIWGVICRPRDFDPNKKYPVIESIYAGPQGSFVPKSFGTADQYAALADLGFIVVQIDGMGTANRSKAFHDVCWHNLKDAGFPDRILWMQAAARKYPYMDLSRVGIFGGSAGGQNAAAGVLFHPEFYKAAVAGCGCHDNRMDKASWNEQWMGYPVGPQYAECSNIENAARLQGKLMLIVGELDENVPVESTFRFADALIKAGKDFDLIVVPGAGHGMGGEYGTRRMRDFFVRHLLGTEPTNRNAPAAAQIANTVTDEKAPDNSSSAVGNETNNRPSINLAPVAKPSSSFVSGDTSLASLNDGYEPDSSGDRRSGSYGNWNRTGTQWVEYEWDQPISTNKIDVYWWADGRGIGLPKSCWLRYWDGDKFVDVNNAKGLATERNQFNTTTFDEVTTSKLRLEIDSDGNLSTGILEWKVYDSGKSPKFPPQVAAGVDRVVVLGGKTYLNGIVRTLRGGPDESTAIVWSKESGSGEVTFENAGAPGTTANFSQLGDYVLKLAAKDGDLSAASTLRVRVESPPTDKPLHVVYTKRYKINSPLWNQRAKALIVNWIPHCIEQINTPDLQQGAGGIDNFVDAANKLAGKPAGKHRGYVFSNAWVHQTVEAMCIALMVDPQGDAEIIAAQQKFRDTLDDWIPKILAAQEPDGYLQTAFALDDRKQRWSPRFRGDHEGYTAGYFLESAINHYTLTDGTDLRLYNAAKKLADCWVANLGPGKKPWFDGHQEMEQALVRFGRFVNDVEGGGKGDAYIALAKFLLDCRQGGGEYDQSHEPVQQQYEAVGHSVRAVYSYSGMADVAAETGDLDYRSAVMSLWDNLTNKKYYVTGGIGSGETSEGFGPNYSLRNNAYCEACSSCGEIFFQYKLNLAYHDAKYADLYEETIFNALLGSVDFEGHNFYYDNPLVGGRPRYPWHVCPCCVGNIPRTLLMIPTWTYLKDDDGIYVNLFIGGSVKVDRVAGTNVEMVQETDYPWSGKVAINVNPADEKEFAVRVRAPQRSVSELYTGTPDADGIESITVNGTPVTPEIVNGYAVIRRSWKAGDRIELVLPMKPQRVKCIDEVAANRGRVALRIGPLVYNVESVDDNDMNGVLAPDAELSTAWRPDLLGGMLVINGKYVDGSPLTAIPNFARNNRGGRSQVWIRDQ